MLFEEYKVNQFLDELASDLPSPGGGSTAALVAALSGCLNNMVYSLTINKKAFNSLNENEKEKMIYLENECKKFIEQCIEFMEEDRTCFIALMDCYKLPKNTEGEKEYRKKELSIKTYNAMLAPLKVCRVCLEFYKNIDFAIEYGNKMLISDAGVAAILLHSAIESSIINVKVNLNTLKDEKFFADIKNELEEIEKKSIISKKNIIDKVNNEILKY